LLAAAAAVGLAACSSTMDDMDSATATGSPFTQALFKDYSDLSHQAAGLPAPPPEEEDFWDSLNPFSGPDTSVNDNLSEAFANKAMTASAGTEPELEPPAAADAAALRARLATAIAAGKDQFPDQAARAQADYDCWMIYGTAPSAAAAAQACKSALDGSLMRLETAARPAPPMPAPAPAPAPAASAPVSDFTVYFDFDSWTLTAEDLKVLTDVITTARAGGQSHISVVGHTDTSGPSDYNQKLSVHRANVVVEALVDMGARRAAITASGVGETDLAVQTDDGVKEAKNRRAVIGLQP
jgi:OOP family OmpA-OmpF porin